jgi:hypothetical protein
MPFICKEHLKLALLLLRDLGGEKKIRATMTMRMVMAMAMCEFMRG